MTTTPAPTDIDTLKADIKQAHDEICNIAEGKRRWTMSIPAKEATDSDLVISRALAGAERALDELTKTRAELANATILLIEAAQHSGLPTVLRQRINGFLAEANPATTAEPADDVADKLATMPRAERPITARWPRIPGNDTVALHDCGGDPKCCGTPGDHDEAEPADEPKATCPLGGCWWCTDKAERNATPAQVQP